EKMEVRKREENSVIDGMRSSTVNTTNMEQQQLLSLQQVVASTACDVGMPPGPSSVAWKPAISAGSEYSTGAFNTVEKIRTTKLDENMIALRSAKSLEEVLGLFDEQRDMLGTPQLRARLECEHNHEVITIDDEDDEEPTSSMRASLHSP
ncbi:hypothetical protein PENTCL1PPCAC_28005, partial [Pristionchus entomophagus]